MLKKLFILNIILLITITTPAIAEAQYDPAEVAQRVAPYIDAQTFALVRINLSSVDINAYVAKMIEIATPLMDPEEIAYTKSELEEFRIKANGWIAEFTQAGGRDIYAVFSLIDFPSFFILTPFKQDADPQIISNLIDIILEDFSIGKVEVFKKGPDILAGSAVTRSRLKELQPVPRPELKAAFTTAGDTSVQVLLSPTPDQRRILAEMLPAIEPQAGSLNTPALMQGIQWAVLSINGPPKMSLDMTVQSQDSESAQALYNLIITSRQMILQDPQNLECMPEAEQLFSLLTPEVKQDRLVLSLNNEQVNIINDFFTPSIQRARQQAQKVICANQLKSLGMAVMIYKNDHKDMNPPNLEGLVEKADVTPEMLQCPQSRDLYVYRGADLEDNACAEMILAYDKLSYHNNQGRNVLWADGHVEWMREEDFQKAIEKDNQFRRKNNLPEIPAE
ncbi:MAG: hypothetical protein JW860_05025 [Sedimentisphaerales bacterium]|nr:hypothetical protein [Sedimentisphaerales bacterium]